MEISELINNLDDYNQISSDKELDLILNELSNFSVEDFIYIESIRNYKNLNIIKLFRKLDDKLYDYFKEESIEKKESYIKSLLTLFQNGLNEVNFLIFLYVNNQINLPIDTIIKKYDFNRNFNEIINKIFEILNNINIQFEDETLSMYYNKEYSKNEEKILIKFLNQINFETDYPTLINYGVLPNHIFQMIGVLYDYNLELFEKLLITDNLFTLIFIIKCMSYHQIDSFFKKHKDFNEKTLLCFLFKFFSSTYNDKENYHDLIVNICIHLYKLNKILFNEVMNNFLNNDFFNEIMGSMFCVLSKEDIAVLFELIPLNDNIHLIDVRTKMLDNCVDNENFKYITELIYKKWEKHLKNSFNERDKSLNILCTDFCNFIITYYHSEYDDEKLLNSMKKLFIKLKNLDSDWSYCITHHINKFLVYYSKLFIFSVIYNNRKLDDDEIKKLYHEFYAEHILFKNFLYNKKEIFLNIFEENLIGKYIA